MSGGGYSSFKEFLKKKFYRLIIPYCFIACTWVVPVSKFFYGWSWNTIVKNFVLGTAAAQLWFLLMLFGTLTIIYVVAETINRTIILAILVSGLCYGLGFIGNHFVPDYYQILAALMYVPYAVIGFKLRQCDVSAFYRIPSIFWLLLQVLLKISRRSMLS
jgi:surface polysaccharide O-acyltransferase-like enzyme